MSGARREKGEVKFFNDKGYGFIMRDEGEPDVFVHYSAIEVERGAAKDDFVTLRKGDRVEFSVEPGKEGKLQAKGVRVINDY